MKWADLDPNGHVRHSVYDDYAADARIRLMEEGGYPPTKFSEQGFGPVVLRQQSRFYREITAGDTITVTIRLAGLSPDASRWKVHHEIIKSNGEKAAVLKVEGTWLDWKTRKATAPPNDLLTIFDQLSQSKNFEELRLTAEDAVETLDGSDVHLANVIQHIALKSLNVVELREFASIVGRYILIELPKRLPSQVIAVDDEEDAAGFGKPQQAVGEGDGCEGLPRADVNLDQRAGLIFSEGLFQIADGHDLWWPEAIRDEGMRLRHRPRSGAQAGALIDPLR